MKRQMCSDRSLLLYILTVGAFMFLLGYVQDFLSYHVRLGISIGLLGLFVYNWHLYSDTQVPGERSLKYKVLCTTILAFSVFMDWAMFSRHIPNFNYVHLGLSSVFLFLIYDNGERP